MLVETYEVTETVAGVIEDKEAVVKLCTELGLASQLEILNPEKTEVCPYRLMSEEEYFIYGTLLKSHIKVTSYENPIPLRVLQVFAHAKTFFSEFEVWHSPIHVDPLLVAKRSYDKYYLLARWGDVLESLDKLKIKAINVWRSEKKVQIERALGKLTELKKVLDTTALADLVHNQKQFNFTFYEN
jgi:hypothetical protein